MRARHPHALRLERAQRQRRDAVLDQIAGLLGQEGLDRAQLLAALDVALDEQAQRRVLWRRRRGGSRHNGSRADRRRRSRYNRCAPRARAGRRSGPCRRAPARCRAGRRHKARPSPSRRARAARAGRRRRATRMPRARRRSPRCARCGPCAAPRRPGPTLRAPARSSACRRMNQKAGAASRKPATNAVAPDNRRPIARAARSTASASGPLHRSTPQAM